MKAKIPKYPTCKVVICYIYFYALWLILGKALEMNQDALGRFKCLVGNLSILALKYSNGYL